jgi:hypothetical protein
MNLRSYFPRLQAIVVFALLLVISSCEENSQSGTEAQQELDASMTSSQSDAEAEGIFEGMFDDAMGVNNDVGIAGTGVFFNRTGNVDTLVPVATCFTVTVIHPPLSLFPAHVVIDFGTAGCTGPDGHTRRGKIIIDYTNRLTIPGAIAVTTFDGFYVDNIKVEGQHKITNTGSLQPLHRQYQIDITNGKLTKPGGDFIEWSGHKTITQVDGLATPFMPRDDVYKIEGNSNGRTHRGNLIVVWQSTITEPLIRRITCRWIVKGRIRTIRGTNPNSPWVAVLDFGPGICDNQAVVTINGQAHQITLP